MIAQKYVTNLLELLLENAQFITWLLIAWHESAKQLEVRVRNGPLRGVYQ